MSNNQSRRRTTAVNGIVIHYYAVCWNEEHILPHFLAHHRQLFDRIFIVDDGSTDRSLKLLQKELTVSLGHRKRSAGESYIAQNTIFYNHAWKESRGKADWVVVGNLDEFTYAKDLRGYLGECSRKGVTVVPVLGFDMISRATLSPGHQLMRTVQNGAVRPSLCRFAIFNPDAIEEIAYSAGRHKCKPVGEVVIPDRDRVLNLHYKNVGLESTFVRMQAQNRQRTEFDRKHGLGVHYALSWGAFMERWARLEADCLNVFEWYRLDQSYPGEVWWRPSGASAFPSAKV
jgi:hypothetical protein